MTVELGTPSTLGSDGAAGGPKPQRPSTLGSDGAASGPKPRGGDGGGDGPGDEAVLSVVADLDVPGETVRQGRVFVTWLLCLALAVLGATLVGAHVPEGRQDSAEGAAEVGRSRAAKARVAIPVGLLLPALLTLLLNRHHRRGGAHARGIVVDLTLRDELRLWGRGHGTRIALPGAEVTERLVDVYAGSLGAWKQRRLRVRGASDSRPGSHVIELAAPATRADLEEGLLSQGGEGDCIELRREAFEQVRSRVLCAAARERAQG